MDAEFYKRQRDELRAELVVVKTAAFLLAFLLLLICAYVGDERDRLAAKARSVSASSERRA